MKRNLLLSLFITLLAVSSFANPVDLATAKTVAANFWSAMTGNNDNGRWTDVTAQTGFHEFYLLTRNTDEGFVIVAADDRVQPILGYSTENSFTTPLPPHVNAVLQGYEVEIAYYRTHNFEASEDIISLWTSLLEGEFTPQSTTAVAPMLTTTWDQSPYYNNLCPASDGQHAVTGCAATATAQIMKFWNWPPTGVGSHSYYDDDFGYQSADFGATTYDWEHMPNALSGGSNSTQLNAVATLMYHVGVAVEMDYGIQSSGAFVHSYGGQWGNMACSQNALPQYFRYKNTLHSYFKDYTSDADWINILTEEIDAGRPVLETGYGDGGGHAFVCDGYDNNGMFHINWGWSGHYNGYFAHNALNPGGTGTGGNNSNTFNDGKAILVGIEPAGLMEVSPSQFYLPQPGGSKAITVKPNVGSNAPWYAISDQSWLTLTPNNGAAAGGSATITATATANTSGNSRTAIVTVSQGASQKTISVTQMADSCTIVSLPWSDSFEEGIGCWTTLDADGDGNNWFLATGVANEGTYSMASFSYDVTLGSALHANNYLVSPPISLPTEGNHEFVFHTRCSNANYPDTLMVKLTTGDGTAASQFSTTLMPLTPINSTEYQQFSVSLSAYNGQTVKVAIVHKAYDGDFLVVDDIYILNTSTSCNITTLSANSAMGTAYGSGTYNAGTTVTLAAIAGEGYRFTGWNDGNTLNPREITALGDATYTAFFANLGGSEHHYDNGSPSDLIGTGSSMSWGIRFPAGELSEFTTYNGTRFWDYDSGVYQVRLYQGGADAPGTLVATQTYTLTGNNTWYDAMLTTPITIDHTQPLWVILYNDGASFPAIGSHYAGNPDGSWISEDGNDWGSICDLGYNLTWMVRALLTGASATPRYTLSVNSGNTAMGLISGGGSFVAGDSTQISANALPGYRFTGWNDGNTVNPRTVTITSDTVFTASYADLGNDERHYDNGSFAKSMGANGTLHWAVRFPAGTLAGHDLLKEVKIMDKNPGTYTLEIYQGGSNAPETLITSETVVFSGSNDWITDTLTTPVSLNHALPLWVVLHNTGVSYPAAGSHYDGNPDGSWISLDNDNWSSVCDYGFHYTWMIRVGLADAVPVTFYTITATSANASQGSVSGGGIYPDGTAVTLTATAAAHHHFVQWEDGSTGNPRTITVTGDASYTAQFEPNMHTITVVSEQSEMGTATGGGTFPYGSVIQIEAIPFDGYEFLRWTGGNTDNPRTITVTGNKSYSALFRVAAGIDDHEQSNVKIFSQGNRIVVDGAEGQTVEIYDVSGKLVARDTHVANHRVFTVTASGVYTVKTDNGITKKVTVVR
jgi:hypothetical protein